ncbi:D-ribose pyranase [Phascolarctobacterium sp.]
MQKIGILNSDIAKVLADLGHTDTIVIGDCGLPVPAGVPKIDLALKPGTPSFLDVLTEVLKYMEVEKIHIAAEMETKNPALWQQTQELFAGKEQILTDHEAFKAATKTAKAVIRTGEITPYANIILHAGVIF